MKLLFVVAAMIAAFTLNAQTKFESAMQLGLGMMKDAKSASDMQEVSAFFERVGEAEKTHWLPFYHAAYANIQSAWMNPAGDMDKAAQRTKDLISKAELIEKDNSELYCLKQIVAIQQMLVDPMSRWQTYGQEATSAIQAAQKADPGNPRAYSLMGQYLMNVPEQFGGGKDVAKPILEKAVSLFKTFKAASPFHPTWGEADAVKTLAQCQ